MKKLFFIALLFGATSLLAQDRFYNRYAMELKKNDNGTYELLKGESRYAKVVDTKAIPDLLTPYEYTSDRLSSKDYKGVETRDFVYTTHDGYSLSLSIDMPVSQAPAPFMIYIHGGGWARGDRSSMRTLSQYLAKNKGIAGVRIDYTLSGQKGATIDVSVADVQAALNFIRAHAAELNIDPTRFGFAGASAGAHLAAVAAMSTSGTKVLVCYSGIYDLETAAITTRTKDAERLAYFRQLDPKTLRAASPIDLIPKKQQPAVQLFHGTADLTVEVAQCNAFEKALKSSGFKKLDVNIYPNYDHGLNNKASDKMEEIFFKTVDFVVANL